MANVFIIHGTGGYPGENWFPWLKAEVEKRGHTAMVPQFPTPENQTLENWFATMEQYRAQYASDSLIVGHSLGGAFSLRVLEAAPVQIRAAFLVSSPIGVPPIKNMEGDRPFIGHPFDWEKIKVAARRFEIFHSDNDPYVGLGNGQQLAANLNVKLNFVPNCGHFNATAGFLKFERLLELIEPELAVEAL